MDSGGGFPVQTRFVERGKWKAGIGLRESRGNGVISWWGYGEMGSEPPIGPAVDQRLTDELIWGVGERLGGRLLVIRRRVRLGFGFGSEKNNVPFA